MPTCVNSGAYIILQRWRPDRLAAVRAARHRPQREGSLHQCMQAEMRSSSPDQTRPAQTSPDQPRPAQPRGQASMRQAQRQHMCAVQDCQQRCRLKEPDHAGFRNLTDGLRSRPPRTPPCRIQQPRSRLPPHAARSTCHPNFFAVADFRPAPPPASPAQILVRGPLPV